MNTSPEDREDRGRSAGLIGESISHYEVIDYLGGGGMGVVYKATDTRLDRTVALKFLPPTLTSDRMAKARFIHEAKAASALDHPNICTIYEIDETAAGQLFIAMAYYQGATLKEKIDSGPLSEEEAVDFAAQIAKGLSRAHDADIIHRDIKPANVMLAGGRTIKIVDFGLAKVAGRTQLTQTDSTVGTVAYMSPEQARGDDVDARTDVWSLGVVLYEMLAGERPFRGEYHHAVIYSIINDDPQPLSASNPSISPELERIVVRALQKEPADRYATAKEFSKALEAYTDSLRGSDAITVAGVLRRMRRPHVAAPTLILLLFVVLLSAWFVDRQSDIRWARTEALPEIERLVESSWRDFTEAYALAERAEHFIPNDPKLQTLLAQSALHVDVDTEPSGADVYMKAYTATEDEWRHVGTTPIDSVRVPIGIFRWRIEKEGYEPVLAAASTWQVSLSGDLLRGYDLQRRLDEEGSLESGMVRVSGRETPHGAVGDFFIDKYEVTNSQYKEFVDSGAYSNRQYWLHDFRDDGQALTWDEAMRRFVDQTGRPGPSTWQAGDYPSGQDNYPVAGVSWYEAAAYAQFRGKSLPTGLHWGLARGEQTPMIQFPQLGGAAIFVPYSNIGGRHESPVEVGSLGGHATFGAFDMAGNVREWCWNETTKGRLIRGGAWMDNTYRFGEYSQANPFDRSSMNGFRTVKYVDRESIPHTVFAPMQSGPARDFYAVEPVDDDVYQVYKEQFSYDKTSLNARIESRDESAEDWIHERITFDAAYGGERMIAHLFLPKNFEPPFQTVIYFPGSASLFQQSSENIEEYYEFPVFLSFLPKNGRAVVYPVYAGTFERHDLQAAQVRVPQPSYLYTEYLIKWVKDFRRSIDYLESRDDIDSGKLAYYGMSWGGALGAIIPAVEERLQASVLAPGLLLGRARPEANQLNYVRRVRTPTLMLNGRYDTISPLETAIQPMYDLLGTPDEHKELKLYDTDHIPPRTELIKEMLVWLDRYLGPVN